MIETPQKSKSAFRTISEVAEELNVPQHVLRFWETKFSQIKPMKRGGGRRYYRPEDVALLKKIYNLLYVEGYTIKGVQKLLKGVSKSQVMAEQQLESSVPQASKAFGASMPQVQGPDVPVEQVAAAQVASIPEDERDEVLRAVLTELLEMREQLRVLMDDRTEEAA